MANPSSTRSQITHTVSISCIKSSDKRTSQRADRHLATGGLCAEGEDERRKREKIRKRKKKKNTILLLWSYILKVMR